MSRVGLMLPLPPIGSLDAANQAVTDLTGPLACLSMMPPINRAFFFFFKRSNVPSVVPGDEIGRCKIIPPSLDLTPRLFVLFVRWVGCGFRTRTLVRWLLSCTIILCLVETKNRYLGGGHRGFLSM